MIFIKKFLIIYYKYIIMNVLDNMINWISMFLNGWFFTRIHVLCLIFIRPINLIMSLCKCRLSSLLYDMFHSNSSDEPITLSLIVVPHMILTEKSESFRINIIKYDTFIHDQVKVPLILPILNNWNGKKRCILFGCILMMPRLSRNNGTSKLGRIKWQQIMKALQLSLLYDQH